MPSIRAQEGQASVELVALVPVLALVAFVLWQAVVAGQALWLAGAAARAAARAEALGADPAAAARRALPARLEDGLRVRAAGDGTVRITLRIPAVLTGGAVASTRARARFVPQAP